MGKVKVRAKTHPWMNGAIRSNKKTIKQSLQFIEESPNNPKGIK